MLALLQVLLLLQQILKLDDHSKATVVQRCTFPLTILVIRFLVAAAQLATLTCLADA